MNEGYTYSSRVQKQSAGKSLLEYLAQEFSHSSRDQWRKRIQAGQVYIDKNQGAAEDLLSAGMEVIYQRPPWNEPTAPLNFEVVYDDGDLLAVNKPSGCPTLPGGGFYQHTLMYQVKQQFSEAVPMHRLGRFTSGLVLFARSYALRDAMAELFRKCKIQKVYRALIKGVPDWEECEITQPIGPVEHALLGTVHGASDHGKPALSFAKMIERGNDRSLCDVSIKTGRPHQIRIHLATIGFPLFGDPLYAKGGKPIPNTKALPGDPGYLLHAYDVQFKHPLTGEAISIQSKIPEGLRALE